MSNNEREQSAIVARLLSLGVPLTRVCRVLALLQAVWLVSIGMHGPLTLARGISGALACASWAYSEWLTARINLDRLIFEDVAHGKLDLAQLDEALGVAPRTIAQRRTGALTLPRRLAMVAALLVVLSGVALMS